MQLTAILRPVLVVCICERFAAATTTWRCLFVGRLSMVQHKTWNVSARCSVMMTGEYPNQEIDGLAISTAPVK
ncbi:hypothetical protein DFH29DRAFT_940653 [Suillus ampliporus]|nr:hypothetical protein DFH29DRAFT_940653 [Suillus ampliporus]